MNHKQIAQYAVLCLEELDAHAGQPVSFVEISRKQGIPLAMCTRILRRLYRAGIVDLAGVEKVVLIRPVEELTAMEILEAVWAKDNTAPAFQMWVGGTRGPRLRKTLEFVRHATAASQEEITNG